MRMRIGMLAIAAAMAMCATATAADLQAVKAAPVAAKFDCGTTMTCIGPYVGIDFSGLNGNFTSLLPGASGNVSGGDMTAGAHGGFQYWNGKYFIAGEVQARASLAQNMSAVGGLNSDRWTFFETVKAGMNVAGLLGISGAGAQANPSASGPIASSGFTVPADFLNLLTSIYVQAGAAQRFNKTGTVTGAGMQFLLAANWTVDLDYKHISWASAAAGPALTLNTEDIAEIGFSYHFGSGTGFLGM